MVSPIPDTAALAVLEQILARAYGTIDGQEELNAVIEPALGLNLWVDVGSKYWRMKDLVHKLRELVVAEGPEKLRTCIAAFYANLPGNEALRIWVSQYQPQFDSLVSEVDFERARAPYVEGHLIGQQQLAISAFAVLRGSAPEGLCRGRDCKLRHAAG